jgi:hypothetical protein
MCFCESNFRILAIFIAATITAGEGSLISEMAFTKVIVLSCDESLLSSNLGC